MKYQNFTYEVKDNEITITSYRGRKAVDLVIPSAIPTEMGDLPVIEIGSASFFAEQITGVTIPDTVKFIGDSAFYGCSNLTKVTIGNGVTSIGRGAFFDCHKLVSVVIPDSVVTLEPVVFCSCRSLTSVTIGNGVTSIGRSAFDGCDNLTSVIIGNNVKYIRESAFDSCSKLKSVTIPDGVTNIDNGVFAWCDNLISINVSRNNKYYSSQDGVLFNKDGTELVCCPGGKTGKYTVPNGITTICNCAFYGCVKLTLVAIPDSVINISEDAFVTGIDVYDEMNKNLQIATVV